MASTGMVSEARGWIRLCGMTDGELHRMEVTMMLDYVMFARLFYVFIFCSSTVQSEQKHQAHNILTHSHRGRLNLHIESRTDVRYSCGFREIATSISLHRFGIPGMPFLQALEYVLRRLCL